jgi:BirA family transcriptional regulator, biotin operon repressor / biotin---[acetyl-CoA-carboxylase] ligase
MKRIAISSPFPDAEAFLVDSTPSTQEKTKALAAAGCPPGSLVAADEQTAGRGRFPERRWESARGKNLLVTIFLGPPRKALPLRVGLALCEAASAYASSIGAAFASPVALKWPNDLMLGDCKAAGILCEANASGAFAGIGLNCNQAAFPPGLAGRATSLALELGREIDRWAILELLLDRLAADLGAEGDWRRAATDRLWRLGESVSFLPGLSGRSGDGGAPFAGTLVGVDEEGSLLIRSPEEAEPRAFAAGELRAARGMR